MSESLRIITLSYKKAPIEVREAFTMEESQTKSFYLKLKDVLNLQEALILSTCNRTEIYYRSEIDLSASLVSLLCAEKALNSEEYTQYFEVINDEASAVNYLFEVSLGLESQVLGDQQIINQVKTSYQWSADMQMAGPFLHRALHSVFYANKRLVQETSFRDGAASTSYVTIDLMESFLPMLQNPKILVLGLGEIGEDLAKTLVEKGHNYVTLCNRTFSKSQDLGAQLGLETLAFENLKPQVKDFDVIISSIRSDDYILNKPCLKGRKSLTYIFDLSIPRSINPEVEQMPGVVLYSLDEIQNRSNETLTKRQEAIPQVKEIISQMVGDFSQWALELQVSPTIQKLKIALEQIRKEELSRFIKGMNESEIEKVDKLTSAIMQKIIKLPVLQLKAACKKGEADTLIDVLNDLFDLENIKES